MDLKYFTPTTDPKMIGLQPELLQKLDMARGRAGVPFVITNGLRTSAENASLKGSASDSAHLTGRAVDLAVEDDHTLFCTVFGLLMAGFNRVGIYVTTCADNPNRLIPRHVHADIDLTKPVEVIFLSMEQN